MQPLPSELLPVLPFEPELLPPSFRPWVTDCADRIQCPIDYCAIAVMVAFASVVGRQVGIRPKCHDDWTVVPNLWGAVIGRPGVMKSPAIAVGTSLLEELEEEAKTRFEKDLAAYEAEQLVADAAKKQRQKEIDRSALKDRDRALGLAQESVNDQPEEPVRKRYVTSDSTVEKLGELLADNPNGIIVFRDELIGFLRSLDREGHEGAKAFYLESWNGTNRFTYDRIARGTIEIEAAIVSILGGIQPGPLQAYLAGAVNPGTADDGLMQRFQLAVWPDVSKDWINVDRLPDTAARKLARMAFKAAATLDVQGLGVQRDADGGIPFVHFDPEGQALFDAWREGLEHRIRSGDEHPALEAHLSKYRSLVPSLGLLHHLADLRMGPVTDASVRCAIGWAEYLESHARRTYGSVLGTAVPARAIAKHILAGDMKDGFALRDAYRPGWTGLPDQVAAERGVDLLIRLGWLAEEENPTRGRSGTIYRINPLVWERSREGPDGTDGSSPGAQHDSEKGQDPD